VTLQFAIRQYLADVYGKPGPPTSLKTGVTGRPGRRAWKAEPLIFNRDAKRDYQKAKSILAADPDLEVEVISDPRGQGAGPDSNPLDFPVAPHWQKGRDYAACRLDVSNPFLKASRESFAAFKGFKFLLRNDELAMTDQARELIDNAPKQELKRTQRRTQTPSPRSTNLFDLLVQRLRDNDLEPVDVDGDGNCQFRALAHQLFADEAHHAAVRQTVCNELMTHADRYSGFVEGTYGEFVVDMTRDKWGDEVTLRAAADAYNVRITVVTTYEDEWRIRIDPTGPAPNGETPTTVCLGLIGEVHYVSVVPLSSNDESTVALPRGDVAKRKRARGVPAAPKSQYEIERDERIKRNEAFMASIGIDPHGKGALKKKAPPPKPRAPKKIPPKSEWRRSPRKRSRPAAEDDLPAAVAETRRTHPPTPLQTRSDLGDGDAAGSESNSSDAESYSSDAESDSECSSSSSCGSAADY